jgi:hypothetical protein
MGELGAGAREHEMPCLGGVAGKTEEEGCTGDLGSREARSASFVRHGLIVRISCRCLASWLPPELCKQQTLASKWLPLPSLREICCLADNCVHRPMCPRHSGGESQPSQQDLSGLMCGPEGTTTRCRPDTCTYPPAGANTNTYTTGQEGMGTGRRRRAVSCCPSVFKLVQRARGAAIRCSGNVVNFSRSHWDAGTGEGPITGMNAYCPFDGSKTLKPSSMWSRTCPLVFPATPVAPAAPLPSRR